VGIRNGSNSIAYKPKKIETAAAIIFQEFPTVRSSHALTNPERPPRMAMETTVPVSRETPCRMILRFVAGSEPIIPEYPEIPPIMAGLQQDARDPMIPNRNTAPKTVNPVCPGCRV
jgi:hypothetical protein